MELYYAELIDSYSYERKITHSSKLAKTVKFKAVNTATTSNNNGSPSAPSKVIVG